MGRCPAGGGEETARFAAAYDRLIVQMSSKGTVRWPSRRLRRTGSTPSTTPARVM